MPNEMSEEELEAQLATAKSVDSFEHRNDEDEDDYIVAELYRTADGRHFRYIDSSGMNSPFAGAGNFGEWLEEKEVADWHDF